MADEEVVETMDLGVIDIGNGKTMQAINVKLPSRNVEKISFFIDAEDKVRELNEDNNFLEMSVASS